jgi:glycosyl transferase family 2
MTAGIIAVLPVRNADPLLETSVLELAAVLDGLVGSAFDIVLVDDGACPAAGDAVAGLVSGWPRLPLHVVRSDVRLSDAAAVDLACEVAERDVLLFTTCDGQFDLRQLNALFEALDRSDVVTGYRAQPTDGVVCRLKRRAWNTVVNLVLGPTGTDVDCALKMFTRDAWLTVRPRSRGASFGPELLAKARRRGLRVAEVPVRHFAANADRPKHAQTGVVRAVAELIELRRDLQHCDASYDARVSVRGRAA